MAHLLSEAAARGIQTDYVGKLMAAFELRSGRPKVYPTSPTPHLSSRQASH